MKKLFKILAACVFVCAMAVSCSSPSNSNPPIEPVQTIGAWKYSPSAGILYTAALTKTGSHYAVAIGSIIENATISHTYAGLCTKNDDIYSTNSISFDNGEVESGEISVTINADGSATIYASFDPGSPRALVLNYVSFDKVHLL